MNPMRRHATRALLLLVLIWSPLHRAFSLRTGASPWKLFALGMYATPPMVPSLTILAVRGGEEFLITPENLPVPVARINKAVEWRWALGELRPGGTLAGEILRADETLDEVIIIWYVRTIDRKTGLLRIESREVSRRR